MAATKINMTATVLAIRELDFPTPGTVTELQTADGTHVQWRANTDTAWWAQWVAPYTVGDILTIQASSCIQGSLRNVRYTHAGREFRGAAYHRNHNTPKAA